MPYNHAQQHDARTQYPWCGADGNPAENFAAGSLILAELSESKPAALSTLAHAAGQTSQSVPLRILQQFWAYRPNCFLCRTPFGFDVKRRAAYRRFNAKFLRSPFKPKRLAVYPAII